MEKVKIGIIVPIYNVEKYLKECIQSVLRQSYGDFELILVDDGSTDCSRAICDEYKDQDKRVKVIYKTNGGLVSARKAGLAICEADYVMYLDGDDWIDADMLESMVSVIEDRSIDVVISNIKREINGRLESGPLHFKDGLYTKRALEETVYSKLICWEPFYEPGILPSLCGKLYRTELLKIYQNNVDNDITLGEDAVCTYPLLSNCKKIYLLNRNFYNYRVNLNSMTLSYNKKQSLGTVILINRLKSYFSESEVFYPQIMQYHGFITMRNMFNVGLAGIGNGFNSRCKDLQKYLVETNFRESFNYIKNDMVNLSSFQKMALQLLSLNIVKPVVFIYAIKSKISNR